MALIENKTCVRFVDRNNEKDYVRILRSDGCYADLGHVGGQQVLSLGTRCLSTGIVLHELMHTLGFYDEHTRPDRDNYVVMHLNNVIPGERLLIYYKK
ncbi:hypothetical protein MTO96_000971 [Rhipicephalus appendiculatus]